MALQKLSDFDPDYQNTFEGDDIKGLDVYTQGTDEKIGTVTDVLVDEEGHFRYLIVDLGFWIFGKKVLLPIGRSKIEYDAHRVYTVGLTKEQAEDLPEFNDRMAVDYDYEERVRGVYRSPAAGTSVRAADYTAPLDTTAPLDAGYAASLTGAMAQTPLNTAPTASTAYDRNSYKYQQEPSLYEMNDSDHQTLKLYQERLIANKSRIKTGEVTVGKRVETETTRVSVPIEKERVVIERVTPADAGQTVAPGEASFQEGEVARMEIYEETPDIHKEAFVREEVRVKKVVDRETVNAEETIRREELDINNDGIPDAQQRPIRKPNDLV